MGKRRQPERLAHLAAPSTKDCVGRHQLAGSQAASCTRAQTHCMAVWSGSHTAGPHAAVPRLRGRRGQPGPWALPALPLSWPHMPIQLPHSAPEPLLPLSLTTAESPALQ